MVLKLLEFCLLLVFISLVITQMLIPSITGRPLFPWFRKEKSLANELFEARQKTRERQLAELVALENEVKKHTTPTKRKEK